MKTMTNMYLQDLRYALRAATACGAVCAVLAMPAFARADAPTNEAAFITAHQIAGHVERSVERPVQYAQAKERRISASQAKSAALRHVRGASFVNVQLVNSSTYRVRVQEKNGKIIDVYVDARTGRVKN